MWRRGPHKIYDFWGVIAAPPLHPTLYTLHSTLRYETTCRNPQTLPTAIARG